MADDIKGKVGLDITDFKTGVDNLNRQIRVIESGFKAAAAGTEDWTQDADVLGQRMDSLTKIIGLQEQKVEAVRKEYERVAKEKGATSKQAQILESRLNRESTALAKSKLRLDQTDKSLKKAKIGTEKLDKSMTNMGKSATRAGNVAKAAMVGVAAAAVAAGASVLGFANKGLNMASDLQEVQNVVDTTFGPEGSGKINAWAKDAAVSFGLSELQAKQFNGTMGAMLKSMGLTEEQTLDMSQSIAGLSADFASFYNLDSEEAFAKIRAGISGETEPLKQLGINMSVANLEAYALEQGITKSWKAMNQAEQATLRYSYLMSVSADAQGDFARTSDSYANQQRIFGLQVDSLAATFGSQLLPAASQVMAVLIEGAQNLDPTIFENLAQTLGEMAVSMAETVVELIPKIVSFLDFVMENGPSILSVIVGIGAGMVAWNVVGIIQGVVAAIKTWQVATAGQTIAQKALNIAMKMNPIGIVITVIATLTASIITLWKTNEKFRGKVIAVWTAVKHSVSDAIQSIKGKFNEWKQLGENIINGIKQGVINAATRLADSVKDAAANALYKAKQFLGIHSPSRLFADEVGFNIGAGVAVGIDKSARKVDEAMNQLNRRLVADAKINVKSARPDLRNQQTPTTPTKQTVIHQSNNFYTKSPAENAREMEVLNKRLALTWR